MFAYRRDAEEGACLGEGGMLRKERVWVEEGGVSVLPAPSDGDF